MMADENFRIKLNPAIRYPDDLDELWRFVENREPGWVFEPREYPQPFVTWSMVRKIARVDDGGHGRIVLSREELAEATRGSGIIITGGIDLSESELFGRAIQAMIRGSVLVCGDADGTPVIYGTGVRRMFEEMMR